MNPRPILIATCCAIALVAFVYFFGKQPFSLDGTADRTTPQPSPPITVNKSPTTSESPLTHSPTRTIEEVHQALEGKDKEYQSLLDEKARLLQSIAARKKSIANNERILAKLKANQKGEQEQDEREWAEIKEINQWLQAEIIPGMNALLPDLAFFFDENIEPSTQAFVEKYPDIEDQRYYLNQFARYEEYLDQITTRVANASESFQKRFLRVGVQLWGEEATQYLASEINRKGRK